MVANWMEKENQTIPRHFLNRLKSWESQVLGKYFFHKNASEKTMCNCFKMIFIIYLLKWLLSLPDAGERSKEPMFLELIY